MREPRWYDCFGRWIRNIEWFFAKRWLDRNFGKKEYWGDWIMQKHLDDKK